MTIIEEGNLISGINNKTVNQIREKGYEFRMGHYRIWPGFEIGTEENSLSFKWDQSVGGTQGNSEIPNNSSPNIIHIFDAAGGNGEVGLKVVETSHWHRVKFRCLVISSNIDKDDNENQKVTIDDLVDRNGNSVLETDGVNKYLILNRHIIIDSVTKLKTDDYDYEHIKSHLLNFNIDNKNSFIENNELISKLSISEYILIPNRDDDISIDSDDTVYLKFSVGANDNQHQSASIMLVDRIYTMFDEEINLYDTKDCNCVEALKFVQSPNILYYVNMCWCKDPNGDYSSKPIMLDTISLPYNTHTINRNTITSDDEYLWLYIELGISVDGGTTIYWNDSNEDNNKSTVVPKSIDNTMLEFEVGQTEDNIFREDVWNNSIGSIFDIIETYGDKPWKYVKIRCTPNYDNDEYNNDKDMENIEHVYALSDVEYCYESSEYAVEPCQYNGEYYFMERAYFKDIYDNPLDQAISNTYMKFKISRKVKTNPWECKVKAILRLDGQNTNNHFMNGEKYLGQTN